MPDCPPLLYLFLLSIRPIVGIPHIPQRTPPTPIRIQQGIRRRPAIRPRPRREIAKPRIPFHPALLVHPQGRVLHELDVRGQVVEVLVHAELGDPDGQQTASGSINEGGGDVGRIDEREIVRLQEEGLEIVNIVGRGVPVDVDEVESQVLVLLRGIP